MKNCPNCQYQNDNHAAFCEQCGYSFISKDAAEPRGFSPDSDTQSFRSVANRSVPKKDNTTILILAGVVVVGAIAGVIFFSLFKEPNNSNQVSTSKASNTSSSETAQQYSTDEEDGSEYDSVIKEAKELTIAGNYRESELKLASIPVSDLSKSEYASVRDAVQEISEQNSEGIREQKNETDKNVSDPSTFVGDFAKWANDYVFYYAQSYQKQSLLTISENGRATRTNYDGTSTFGKATVTGSSGGVLSYNTNAMYPVRMPETKIIRPDVKITVQWNNGGGTQIFYGYLSYSSRLVLTDGIASGGGVNEVWITY